MAGQIEESLLADGDALECLAAATLVAATQVMQLVNGRSSAGAALEAARVFRPTEITLIQRLDRQACRQDPKAEKPLFRKQPLPGPHGA